MFEFLVDAPRVEFVQGVPLVGWTLAFPVVRDAPVSSFGCWGHGVGCFDLRNSPSNHYWTRTRKLDWTVMMCKTVDRECAKTVFKGWWDCRS